MHALATILATEASSSEEVPYFIAGGLFALWAVVISLFGMRNPDFPKNARQGRITLLISGILGVATLGLLITVTAV
jgi:hypothetical protein